MIRGLLKLSWENRLRVGIVQPREEKGLGRPHHGLPVFEEAIEKSGRATLYMGR